MNHRLLVVASNVAHATKEASTSRRGERERSTPYKTQHQVTIAYSPRTHKPYRFATPKRSNYFIFPFAVFRFAPAALPNLPLWL